MSFLARKSLMASAGISKGTTLAINIGDDKAAAVDISDATNMSLISSITSTSLTIGRDAAIDIDNDLVYYPSSLDDSVAAIDISNTSSLSVTGTFTSSTYVDSTDCVAIDPINEICFAGGITPNYLTALNVSNPSSISRHSSLSLSYSPKCLAVDPANQVVFVGAGFFYYTVDYSTVTSMSLLDTGHFEGNANGGVDVRWDLDADIAYVASTTSNSLAAFDTSDRSNLSTLGYITDSTNIPEAAAVAIDPANNVAFVMGGGKLSSINISNPASMSRLNTLSNTDFAGTVNDHESLAIDTARQLLFVAARTNNNKLFAIDYSNTSSLSIVGTLTNAALSGGTVVIK